MEFVAAIRHLAGERNDLADDQLGDRAGVGEGGVEDADTVLRGVFQVDLVRADAEASYDDEVLRCGQDARGKLCFRADAEDVDISGSRIYR